MKSILRAALAVLCLCAPALGQTAYGTKVVDNTGALLSSGQWCFGATCLTVTNGAFSGSVTAGTQTVTVTNGSGTTYLTVPGVSIAGSFFSWDGYVVPSSASLTGMGAPRIACTPGAQYTQTDGAGNKWVCQSINGAGVWNGQPVPSSPIIDSVARSTATNAQTLAASALKQGNNLSDLGSPSAARANLGLGTAATQNISAFDAAGAASSAQAAAIAASLQKNSNLSDLASAATARANLGILWLPLTGSGAPTASCASANYGQPYTDTTNNLQYTCGASGWFNSGNALPGVTSNGANGINVSGALKIGTTQYIDSSSYSSLSAACSAATTANAPLLVTKAWTGLTTQTCAANLLFPVGAAGSAFGTSPEASTTSPPSEPSRLRPGAA